jgi:hypothetical protein
MAPDAATSLSGVEHTKAYLIAVEEELAKAKDSAALIAAMTAAICWRLSRSMSSGPKRRISLRRSDDSSATAARKSHTDQTCSKQGPSAGLTQRYLASCYRM